MNGKNLRLIAIDHFTAAFWYKHSSTFEYLLPVMFRGIFSDALKDTCLQNTDFSSISCKPLQQHVF